MKVFDISNPALAVTVSTVTASSLADSVVIQGDFAYVNTAGGSIYMYNIANPYEISSMGTITSGGLVESMQISGRYLYAVNWTSNLFQIFDLGGIYTSSLEAGSAEISGQLTVDGNTQLAGDASIQGGLGVGGSLAASGSLGVAGSAYVQGSMSVAGWILGGLSIAGISATTTPTVTPQGTAGSTSYSYIITAMSASGGETTAPHSWQYDNRQCHTECQ